MINMCSLLEIQADNHIHVTDIPLHGLFACFQSEDVYGNVAMQYL